MLVTKIKFVRDHANHNAGAVVPFVNKSVAALLCKQGVAVLVAEDVEEAPAPIPEMPAISEAVQVWREANGFPRITTEPVVEAPQKPAQAATTPSAPRAASKKG